MGDTHFILRHALTGAVFLFFLGLGAWSVDPGFLRLVARAGPENISHLLTIAVSSALIGITIQGIHVGCLHLIRDRFADRARTIVQTEVRKVFDRSPDQVEGKDRQKLEATEADAFFVWLYHRLAPNELIEWARRRRSYYYLGISWAIACGTGWAIGALWMALPPLPHAVSVAMALGLSLLWSAAAILLARRMRRDADEMEFLWAVARVRPELRRSLTELLSRQDDTHLTGAIEVALRRARASSGSAQNRAPVSS